MRRLVSILVLLSACHAYAEPGTQTRLLPAACQVVQSAEVALLKERGFTATSGLDFETRQPRDGDGRKIRSAESIVRRYVVRLHHTRNPIIGAWIVHTAPRVTAFLSFKAARGGCTAGLLFHFSWCSAEILILLPVDGDPQSEPSNGMLETSYLDAISRRLGTGRGFRPTPTTP